MAFLPRSLSSLYKFACQFDFWHSGHIGMFEKFDANVGFASVVKRVSNHMVDNRRASEYSVGGEPMMGKRRRKSARHSAGRDGTSIGPTRLFLQRRDIPVGAKPYTTATTNVPKARSRAE